MIMLLISVIIPTSGRHKTLIKVLKDIQFKIGHREDVEVIVEDNGALPIELNKDIRYFHNAKAISISENFDNALKKARGKYILVLGDDDFLGPDFNQFLDSINFKFAAYRFNKAYYYYNNTKMAYPWQKLSPWLRYQNYCYTQKVIKANDELIKVAQAGGCNMFNLPSVYHGVVRKDILDFIFYNYGTYFPGPSPDMANGVAVASLIKEYLYIDKPLIISGKGNRVKGDLMLKHSADLQNVKHLKKEYLVNWSKEILHYWLPETVWAESFIQAQKKTKHKIILNIKELNIRLLLNHYEVLSYLGKNRNDLSVNLFIFYKRKISSFIIKLRHHLKFKRKKIYNDIQEVNRILSK